MVLQLLPGADRLSSLPGGPLQSLLQNALQAQVCRSRLRLLEEIQAAQAAVEVGFLVSFHPPLP